MFSGPEAYKRFHQVLYFKVFLAVLVINPLFTPLSFSLRPPTLVSITLLSSCGLPMARLCYFVSLWLRSETPQPLLLSTFPSLSLLLSLSPVTPTKAQAGLCAWCRCPGPWKELGLRLGELRGPFTQTPTCRTIWPRWVTLTGSTCFMTDSRYHYLCGWNLFINLAEIIRWGFC